MTEPKFRQRFESLLAEGLSVPAAAEKAKITLEDAKTILAEAKAHKDLDADADAFVAKAALKVGVKALQDLAEAAEDEGVRCKAGAELVKVFLEIRKTIVPPATPKSSGRPPEGGGLYQPGLWDFKDSEFPRE